VHNRSAEGKGIIPVIAWIVVIGLILWQAYEGIALSEIGIGPLTFKFGQASPGPVSPTATPQITPVPPSPPTPVAAKLSPDPFFLSSSPSLVWTQSNIHGGLQLGKVYWQFEVWIDGLRYEHAIGMHAPDNGVGFAEFKVPPGANFFQTVFGFARDDKNPNHVLGGSIGRHLVLLVSGTTSGGWRARRESSDER
jgi:hypothetical protein